MKRALYLHGFNSATKTSNKTETLEQLLTRHDVSLDLFTYDTNASFDHNMSQIPTDYDLYIGTSLGGYYSIQMGNKFKVPFIAINPAINPSVSLTKYLGTNVNYVTGVETTLKHDTVLSYPSLSNNESPGLVLLSDDDEVLDSSDTYNKLNNLYSCVTFKSGGHRFNNIEESVPYINKFLNTLPLHGLFNG